MSDRSETVNTYIIRLELVDEPGALLRALRPIGENGGNLLSIFHERGNVTPRGHIPVEVDLEARPDQYDAIVESLRKEGINVIQAGSERYSESLTLVLSGHIVDTNLTDTLSRIRENTHASIVEFALSAPDGNADTSSARLRLAVEAGAVESTLATVRDIAVEKGLHVIEPLTNGDTV